VLGGTLGLDTVGGEIEEQARERSAAALAVLAVTLVAKLAAGGLAPALASSRTEGERSLITLGFVGGAGLALYGGVLVIAGTLALAGVGDSSAVTNTRCAGMSSSGTRGSSYGGSRWRWPPCALAARAGRAL
jgi:hypothetical protein